jgi:glycosyltransferase involved in cell wall biosynthesis
MNQEFSVENDKQIKLLVLASPSTKNAGAYQFWDHLRFELEQQQTPAILFRGHPEDDMTPNEPLKLRAASSLRFRRRVLQIIADEKITHVVSSISQSDIVFALLLARKARVPWIVYALGQPFPVKGQGRATKRILWRFLWCATAGRAIKVLTVSDYLTNLLSALLPHQEVVTVYPGLPRHEREKLRSIVPVVSHGLNVGFIGRLSPEKDPATFCRIALGNPSWSFEVFGDGPMRGSLEPAFPTVKFHGFTERYIAFERMDIMLITSISEGLPTILLEAGEANVLPIVADVGGCSEAIHPLLREKLVVPRDERESPDSWRARISALTNLEVRREYVELQRKWLTDTFDLSRTATILRRSLNEVGSGNH